MAHGTIVQSIGAVIDIEFPREHIPNIYDALILEDSAENTLVEKGLTFEVEQQLGDGVVRCIALGSSDGLRRGMKVSNTGAPISVPVWETFMGRRMGSEDHTTEHQSPNNHEYRLSLQKKNTERAQPNL